MHKPESIDGVLSNSPASDSQMIDEKLMNEDHTVKTTGEREVV